jgi:hypothetical protein
MLTISMQYITFSQDRVKSGRTSETLAGREKTDSPLVKSRKLFFKSVLHTNFRPLAVKVAGLLPLANMQYYADGEGRCPA